MKYLSCVLLSVAAAASAAPNKDAYAPLRAPIAKIVGASYDGAVLAQLTDLTDSVGARVTGTKAYARGVDWAMVQLRAAGAQNVHVEKFTLEHGWQRGVARASIVTPIARPVHVESLGWSPATPSTGVRGQVVLVRGVEPLPAGLKGKIVLFVRSAAGPKWTRFRAELLELQAAGALAVMVQMPAMLTNNVQLTGAAPLVVGGKLTPLPVAGIGLEDGLAIARQLEIGPVTMEIELPNVVTGPVEVANVIGELVGHDRPNEWILVGAHLDSWDFATGAQDNGAGLVQVIQTARVLAAAGPLKRTVRFALWGGEEQGMVGSHAYTVAHESELASCILAINTDNGAGHVQGWNVDGRPDVQAALSPISDGLLQPLGGAKLDFELTAGSDDFSFVVAGVPTINLQVDTSGYDAIHHTAGDTIEKLDSHALGSGLAVIAVTAFAIASSTEPFAPRLDRAAVEKLVKPAGYDERLRLDGWWK